MQWGLLCQHPDEYTQTILDLQEGNHTKNLVVIKTILDKSKYNYRIGWRETSLSLYLKSPAQDYEDVQGLTIATMRGNCGVAELYNITCLEFYWPLIQELLIACNYTTVQLGTINIQQKAALEALGFQLYNTFVNKRSKHICYLLMKQL